ncbi:MAG TPA: hypothetical protein VFO86_14615 [Terriglobia bacterium]|jgi:hypothetical protein|nr:hypothetical protein [Terriglobia bacterium]
MKSVLMKCGRPGKMAGKTSLVLLSSVIASLVVGVPSKAASDVYLSAPKADAAHPYVYHNTFPKGVGDFVSSKEVGGDVFAPGLQVGDKFPLEIKIQDENNHEHTLASFAEKGPIILMLALVSAPEVMDQVAEFQKFVKASKPKAQIIIVNVGQFGSSLQPKTPMADNGRTIKVAAKEYGLTLPFYWVDNDIYSPTGFTNLLRARDLPTVYVIGKDGKIIREFRSAHTKWAPNDLATSQ